MIRLLSLLIAASFVLMACGQETSPSRPDAAADQAVALYSCGMHPHVVQEGPGICPICGMDLTPIKGTDRSSPTDTSTTSVPRPQPHAISIDPVVVQNMGVRVEPARRQTIFRHLRSIGEVGVGEDQISVVNLRFSGWVEKIHVDKTGDPVEEGQPLFEIYSPDLVATQEEFLLALRTQGPRSGLARSARRKLELLDLAETDIASIAQSGVVHRSLPIRSPRTGHVLQKNLVEGARVMAGKDLYRIGDLTRIWVTAEVYEFDAPWVEVGQPAQMELSYQEGQVFHGKVAYIYPTLSEVSRTLTVRLEFDNPDIRLKPGMFATVNIQYRRVDDVLAIPNEAIIDSGRRKIVLISVDDGRFEPREIVTGLTGDRRLTEVISGIKEGDLIVASGQFLLDSESQLQEAINKLRDRRPGNARPSQPDRPDTVYSCPMHPEVLSAEPGRCPECGMDLEERPASSDEVAQMHAIDEERP
jgi:Cu(I)/Ag(I) efflux system membrane fusion protein/cobalt-zinc-cadmium efflux system membrane fusion protein